MTEKKRNMAKYLNLKFHKAFMRKIFYYIEHPPTPSSPIGLVKTDSEFIVRSVETGLGR